MNTNTDISNNIKSKSIWMRLVFMLIVALLYSVSRVVVAAVIVFQFFWVLFTGEKNTKLQNLGLSLAEYTYQIVLYLTFTSEDRPFPFDLEWPRPTIK